MGVAFGRRFLLSHETALMSIGQGGPHRGTPNVATALSNSWAFLPSERRRQYQKQNDQYAVRVTKEVEIGFYIGAQEKFC